MSTFANSAPTETLRFRLHSSEETGGHKRYSCSLYRTSDDRRMAWAQIDKTVL